MEAIWTLFISLSSLLFPQPSGATESIKQNSYYTLYLIFPALQTERLEMHIISLIKFLLSILRKARNLSTLVALRSTTAVRRHVPALTGPGVANTLVRFWLWIVSRDRKSNHPGSDTSLPPEQHFQADNPPDYIACASAPDIIDPPSNTGSSSDTAGHTYHAEGARVNQNDSSIQEHQGLSTGATENENPVETAVVSVAGGSNVSVNANSSEMPATWSLRPTTPSLRKRYERKFRMYVVSIFATSIL